MATTTLQKWGNSLGFRIPKTILNDLNWLENEQFSITEQENKIIIEPTKKRKSIQELFEGYDDKYELQEFDWGKNVGKEIW